MKRNAISKHFGNKSFTVNVIPTLKDNFSYLIADHKNKLLIPVDVNSDYAPIVKFAEEHYTKDQYTFKGILSTHKHWDHAGGNTAFKSSIAKDNHDFAIYGSQEDNIPGATVLLKDGDKVKLTDSLSLLVRSAPCHTKGHLLYAVTSSDYLTGASHSEAEVALFTGDTLFLGGLGAFFEGNATDMCAAMKKIYTLHTNFPNGEESDSKTFIFPGHEYTMGFMKFSAKILSDLITCSGVEHKEELKAELDLVQRNAKRYQDNINQGNPSVPSSLKEEKVQNLFLRCSDANFLKNMSQLHKNINNEIQLMDYLYNACD